MLINSCFFMDLFQSMIQSCLPKDSDIELLSVHNTIGQNSHSIFVKIKNYIPDFNVIKTLFSSAINLMVNWLFVLS